MPAFIYDTFDFWTMPWSLPFRSVCRWFTPETQLLQGRPPDKTTPRWARPLFLQRWVAQAITNRFAWLEAHPHAPRYCCERESEPDWGEGVSWARPERGILRACSKALLLKLVEIETERLLRVAEEHPRLVGELGWTCEAMGASAQLGYLYAELKRRYQAAQARALLRSALDHFVAGQENDAGTTREASEL